MRHVIVCVLLAFVQSAFAEGMSLWALQVARVQSASRVLVKQFEASNSARGESRRVSVKAVSNVLNDNYNRAKVAETINDYGPDSQLVDPCYQVGMAKTVLSIKDKAELSAFKSGAQIYAVSDSGETSAGGVVGFFGGTKQATGFSFAASQADRATRHQKKYCSVSEASAGYCTLMPNGMQSGDSDFSVHLAPGKTFGWDQLEAATDFVKTVAPVKPILTTGAKTCDASCTAALVERRTQEAYLSMARFSMTRFVASRTTQADGDAKSGGVSQ